MTSSELVGICQGHYAVADTQVDLSPDEVYEAADLAQNDLLNEVRPLDRQGTLALASGQAEYAFSKMSLTGATNATPIVISKTAHGLHTGDKVTIAGVLGNTAANGRWVVTRVTADTFSLDGSVGNGAYTSGGTIEHDLMSMLYIRNMYRIADPYGEIYIRDSVEAEFHRAGMTPPAGATPTGSDVVECYVIHEDYLKLVFLGTPTTDMVVNFIGARRRLDSEKVSSTVNPILPDTYRQAMIIGTMYYVMMNYNNAKAKEYAMSKLYPHWMNSLNAARRLNGRSRYIYQEDPRGLVWR